MYRLLGALHSWFVDYQSQFLEPRLLDSSLSAMHQRYHCAMHLERKSDDRNVIEMWNFGAKSALHIEGLKKPSKIY
jgi:phospholipid N-methyltransferase